MLTTSALCTAALLAFGAPSTWADEVIDNATESVIGTDGGTQASPWNIGDNLLVGQAGTGTLNISDGGEVTNTYGFIGLGPVSIGTVTVDGAGSTWTNSDVLFIGDAGAGTLSITGGGAVSNTFGIVSNSSGSSGTVTVDGTGSTWTNSQNLHIGDSGTGTLSIANGGAVSNTNGYIGLVSGSDGKVTVTGAGSTWTNSTELYVGWSGTGELTIADGGTVEVNGPGKIVHVAKVSDIGTLNIGAALGETATGAGTLDAAALMFGTGTGTLTFNHTDTDYDFAADISGNGTINHLSGLTNLTGDSSGFTGATNADGGTLNIAGTLGGLTGTVGSAVGTTGEVTVTGAGAAWATSEEISVGRSGTGTLTIADGGTVTSIGGFIGEESGSEGSVTVDGAGSTWTTNADGPFINYEERLEVASEGTGMLTITDGGKVANANGYIGRYSGSIGTATVDGAGSIWTSSSVLYVGDGGTGTLNVANGGTVSSKSGYISFTAGSSGTVTVEGPGSSWVNSNALFVGNGGEATLNILDGGTVSNTTAFVGNNSGSDGTVTVDGTGSTWTNSSLLFVGNSGSGTLNITGGGAAGNTDGVVGNASGSDGTVTVTDAGSKWTISNELYVGYSGTGELTIANDGTVDVNGPGGFAFVARNSSSTGTLNIGAAVGESAVAAGTLDAHRLVFGNGSGTLNFNHTEDYYAFGADISGGGTINQLSGITDLTGDSSGFTGTTYANGGTLIVTGTLGGSGGIIGSSAGTTGDVSVLGSAASWTTTTLRVGDQGTGSLTIAVGGTVSSGDAWIGNASGAIGTVSVTGTGSSLAASNGVDIGRFGTGTLNILDGATVTAGNDSFVGYRAGSNGTVNVSGDGSSFEMGSNDLYVGDEGTGALNIENGGAVSNRFGIIGNDIDSVGTANVDGDGSTWTTSLTLMVGNIGSGTLNITNSGTVNSNGGYVGINSGSDSTATVDGTGSSWTNSAFLNIGEAGTGTLNITNGGAVSNTTGHIGSRTGSNGAATVDGAGSTWTNSLNLVVGFQGAATLTISDGGAVSSDAGYIGYDTDSNGAVTVEGAGSTWTNLSDLYLGSEGTAELTISDGGRVEVNSGNGQVILADVSGTGTLNIGAAAGDTAAGAGTLDAASVIFGDGDGTLVFNHTDADYEFAAAVSGEGTIKHLSGVTTLTGDSSGFSGIADVDGGTLVIAGQLGGAIGDIGYSAGSTGYVSVLGTGASWTASALSVGDSGTGTLTIADGGTVSNSDATIGWFSDAIGTVTVTGENSSWAVADGFEVGRRGTGTLNILDGATVTAGNDSFIGDRAGSDGTVNVSGDGSSFEMGSNHLFVGDEGTGALNIMDGGAVSDNTAYVGNNADGTGTVTVNGTGSIWDHSSMFSIGYNGEGVLKVENGGSVSAEDGYVAFFSGSEGTVTVTGAGSTWDTDATIIGDHGTGRITIADGGALVTTNGYLGAETGTGIATVTGSGSKWTSAQRLVIGDFATGTMTIADGGVVRSNAGIVDLGKELGADGTLNIGAATGETAVGAGTLQAEMVQFGQGAGTINFNHTDTDYELAVDLSKPLGSGTINHIAGVTRLTGDASAFDGTTKVTGGTLHVNNVLGGTVNVTGGALGGSGTLATVAIASGGTIAPGNSIGTLNVADITIAAGSTYVVEVNSAGQSDLIDATGTATINGGTVTVTPFPGYALDTAYTIVTAAGGVTGAFDTASFGAGSLFITPTLAYDANNAFVTLAQTVAFSSAAMTPNQIAAAGGADSLGVGSTIFDAIVVLGTAAEARTAFDTISGEIHASVKTALLEDSRFPREAAMDRLRAALGGVGGDDSARIEDRISESFGLWGQGFGSWGQWESDGNAAALARSIGGVLVGADTPVFGDVRFGVLGGYSRSSFSVDDRASSGTADTYTLGAYSGGELGAFTLTGGLAGSWHSLDTSRAAAFPGLSDRLSASYSARTLQAWGEATASFKAGAAGFEPFANLAYVNLSTDGFTEGGGAAALTAASATADATFSTIGLRAETDVSLGDADATLRGLMGWRHAFGDTPTSLMAFASAGDAFTIAGVPLSQETLVLDAGLDISLSESATLGVVYGGQFGSSVQDHSARASLNGRF